MKQSREIINAKKREYRLKNIDKIIKQERASKLRNKKKCCDCDNLISPTSTRCVKCDYKGRKGKYYPHKVPMIGDKNPAWKGGKVNHSQGYIRIYCLEHPYRDGDNYVLEHRLVMEKQLGRYLTKEEVVHHINGIKTDNRIENLRLFDNQSKHVRYHGGVGVV